MHDENAPLDSILPGKQIHQKNKSTPALSTLLQNGAQKAGAKRTAFADVSNTSRAQPAQDDSVINGKDSKVVVSNALLKPAQRPLTTKTVLQTTTSIPTKPAASSIPAPPGQTAIARKLVTKRSTSVLKETTKASVTHTNLDVPAEQDTAQDDSSLPELQAIAEETTAAAGPVQPIAAPVVPSSRPETQYILALEHQAQSFEAERDVAETLAATYDAEGEAEYEEDELEFEPDEYTRNMTGGATATTVVLAPRYTKRVQDELVEAKILVEGSRTAEDIEEEQWDTSMVAEYGDEIFAYMRKLEVSLDNVHILDTLLTP